MRTFSDGDRLNRLEFEDIKIAGVAPRLDIPEID